LIYNKGIIDWTSLIGAIVGTSLIAALVNNLLLVPVIVIEHNGSNITIKNVGLITATNVLVTVTSPGSEISVVHIFDSNNETTANTTYYDQSSHLGVIKIKTPRLSGGDGSKINFDI
jgi:hypothetical protein